MHRYEGTINQFLGDGFMALFGAPIAHEDHARRAVLAALGIMARTQLTIRIGINSGLVCGENRGRPPGGLHGVR